MKHMGTKNIFTKRLYLRKITILDSMDFFKLYDNKEVLKNFMGPILTNEEDALKMVQYLCDKYEKSDFYFWAIALKETDQMIGIINAFHVNEENKEIEVGYSINFDKWNNGYATETLLVILDYLLIECTFDKVICAHFLGNDASGKVMKKCNMKFQEIKTKEIFYQDKFQDVIYYFKDKEEYA